MDRRDRGRSAPSSPYPQGQRRGRMMQASNHSFGTGTPTRLAAPNNRPPMSFGTSPRTQHQLVSQSYSSSTTTDYGILPTETTPLSGQGCPPGPLHHWNRQQETAAMGSPNLPDTISLPSDNTFLNPTQTYPPWSTMMLQTSFGGRIPLPSYYSSESSFTIPVGAFPLQSRYQHDAISTAAPYMRQDYVSLPLQQRCEESRQHAIPASTSAASSYDALPSRALLATHYSSPGIQAPLPVPQPTSQRALTSGPFLTTDHSSPETLPPLLEPQPAAPADAMKALTLAEDVGIYENAEEGRPTVRGRAGDRKATAAGRAELRSGAKRSASLRACQSVYKEGEHLFPANAVATVAKELQTRFTAQIEKAKAECKASGVKFKNMEDKEGDLLFHIAAQSLLQRQACAALNGRLAGSNNEIAALKREIAVLKAHLHSFQ